MDGSYFPREISWIKVRFLSGKDKGGVHVFSDGGSVCDESCPHGNVGTG